MKPLYIAALLFLAGINFQCRHHDEGKKKTVNETENDTTANSKYLIFFNKTAPLNDSSDIGVDWAVEKPASQFDLAGKNKLTCRFELLNDSIAVLSQNVKGTWQEQDRFKFEPWHWIITDTEIASNFETKDFDKDGDEDVLCCVFSNMNANQWTQIYLNNGRRLVKLYNTADASYIWDDPVYDAKAKTIRTELYSGAYGIQNTAFYMLYGTTAVPIIKSETDLTHNEYFINNTYKAVNGKWVLVKSEKELVE